MADTPMDNALIDNTPMDNALMDNTLVNNTPIGRKPIEKNISIADENFVIYGTTYPKRARGLVKKGRARYIDENTICMPRPSGISEDYNMGNINKSSEEKVITYNTAAESGQLKNTPEEKAKKEVLVEKNAATQNIASEEKTPEYTLTYVLAQIENIAKSTEYLDRAFSELAEMKVLDVPDIRSQAKAPDIGSQAKANALADIIKCRETTNQQLLRIYEKMYDDIISSGKTDVR